MKTPNVLLIIFLLAVCISMPSFSSTSLISPEDLSMVTLSMADTSIKESQWWPSLPEFYGDSFRNHDGELFYIAQTFRKSKLNDSQQLETALTLFTDDASAKAGYAAMLAANGKEVSIVDGPRIADECCYFTQTSSDRLNDTTLRFRQGSIICRISTLGGPKYDDTKLLAQYARPIVQRAKLLLDGKLNAKPLTNEQKRLLPSDSIEKLIGPVLGTVPVPAECWAMTDTDKNPLEVRDNLYRKGLESIVLRRYNIAKDPKQVIEILAFKFPDKKSAADWAHNMLSDINQYKILKPGRTGKLSGFTFRNFDSPIYELTFAKGRIVADVSAWAPFDDTSSVCEESVRQLAEQWYASLSDK